MATDPTYSASATSQREEAALAEPTKIHQTEAQFQRAVVEAATLYGWRSCHTRRATVRQGRIATPTSVPGWPDLVLWNPEYGGVMFVELKAEGGRVSSEQLDVLKSLELAGAVADIWYPSDWPRILELLQGGR
jgi:hypothetical protein